MGGGGRGRDDICKSFVVTLSDRGGEGMLATALNKPMNKGSGPAETRANSRLNSHRNPYVTLYHCYLWLGWIKVIWVRVTSLS